MDEWRSATSVYRHPWQVACILIIWLAQVPLAAGPPAGTSASPHSSGQNTTLPCFLVMMAWAEKFTTVRLIGSCFWTCNVGGACNTLHKFVKEIYWVGLCRTTQGKHAHGLHNINFPLTCNRCVSIFLDLRQYLSNPLGMESSERIWVRWLSTNI